MNSFDDIWEEIHSSQEWGMYPSEHVIRFVARHFYNNERNKIRILDFGCGGGAHTWYLAREGFSTYAFDGSKSAVEKVENRLRKENLSAELSVCDGIKINYEDNFFDAVIDNVAIYANTAANIRTMYEKIFKTLKVGGLLLTVVFTNRTSGALSGNEIEFHTYRDLKEGNLAGRGIVHFFEEQEVRSILKEVGFSDIIVDTIEYTDKGQIVSMLSVQARKK